MIVVGLVIMAIVGAIFAPQVSVVIAVMVCESIAAIWRALR